MSVHYKFKSALSFDTITFDGLHISVRDLKKAILQQKQIGKATDFDLQITNAQSNEVYDDENVLIPKNSSLIVVRVPLTAQQKKNWEKSDTLPSLNNKAINSEAQDPVVNRLAKTVDLANVDASEGDKIQAAITQSTLDYDPSNYLRIKGSNQVGELPANYRCYKCLQPGHWIKDCKLNAQQDSNAIEIKKSTGIPRSFMVPVEGPQVPGAMMTPTGQFAVPSIEHEARREPIRKPIEPAVLEKPTIPDDLLCGVCKDLLNDAVLIPCCGNSFCDECIRNFLLESEEHQCPDCNEKDVSPDTLIPNRFLRNSVNNFKNQTGYMRSIPVKHTAPPQASLVAIHPSPMIPAHLVDDVQPSKRSPPPLTPASPDNKEEPTVSPDEIVIVNEVDTEPAAPASPLGNAIPALQTDPVYPSHRHPIHLIPSRLPPNPNICPKGEDKHHHIKDKPGGYMNKRSRQATRKHERSDHWRTDRSGTPTVDERNNDRYQSINVHVSQPGMTQPLHHVNQAPMNNSNNQHSSTRAPHPIYQRGGGGNYMYARQPHYVNRAARAPPMPYTYPPGGGPPHLRGAPPYRGRPRAPYNRTHSPNNTTIPTGPIDDPVEIFERLMIEKDLRLNQRRAQRQSHSRSPYSRSRSRTPRSPRRVRSPSRSRSRTRASTRTRSHSRSPLRRRRSRSRSQFSISRSSSRSVRSRSQGSRSPSRERRDYSPRRRADYRSPLRPASPPTRYYSQRYKEEQYNSVHANRNGRGRYIPKPQEYYSHDYPRENDRYDRAPGRERERERLDRDRGDKPERFDRMDRVERSDRSERVESRVERPERLERVDRVERPERLDRGDRLERNERIDRERDRVERGDRERDRIDRDRDRDRERETRSERERGDRGDRNEKDRGFERIDRERIDRERLDNRDRGVEKDRDRDRERDKDRDRERDRNYSTYKRYDTFETMRDYEHPVRDLNIVRDWEKTRDREIEMREKEKQAEYYRKREQRGNPVEIIETSREPSAPPGVNEEERDRVLIDLPVRTEPLEKPRSPDKEKKPKEKKKKKKEDSERKKKKKKLKDKSEKKEALEEGEIAPEKPEQVEQPVVEEQKDELYGDLGANIDQFVVQNYNKPITEEKKEQVVEKDVMLAPVPELSKWEKDEEVLNQVEENKRTAENDNKQVTSEILERAMNVIIKKSVKPIEKKMEKKPEVRENRENRERRSRERDKEKREEAERHSKDAPKSVALPVKADYEKKRSSSKSRLPSHSSKPNSSVRISAKERLGAKIEEKVVVKREVRADRREIKILEKIPKSVVRRERENTPERSKTTSSSSNREYKRPESKYPEQKPPEVHVVVAPEQKKPTLDENIFEPDYEKSDHENEEKKNENPTEVKKRSCSIEKGPEPKKTKIEIEPKISSEDSSLSSDDSSRSHKKKKKKKHKKKKGKKKKHDSSSDSDSSDSSSASESERKKKKHKHKSHKKSKKRKKSKK